jgi:hypothetical protein
MRLTLTPFPVAAAVFATMIAAASRVSAAPPAPPAPPAQSPPEPRYSAVFALAAEVLDWKPERLEGMRRDIDKGVAKLRAQVEADYGLDPRQAARFAAAAEDQTGAFLAAYFESCRIEQEAIAAGLRLDDPAVRAALEPAYAAVKREFESEGLRAQFRNEILRPDQRAAFDRAVAEGRDVFTGKPLPAEPVEHRRKRFTGRGEAEKAWARWLDAVAARTKMTDEQRQRALQLLERAREAAADYRRAHEADYAKLVHDFDAAATALAGKPDHLLLKAIERRAEQMFEPVDAIGRRWRRDVLGLLTEEQRRKLPASVLAVAAE